MKNYIYILTNSRKTVLYIGVTSDLKSRIHKHKTDHYPNSFTAKYNVKYLIYFERFKYITEAIAREKYLKGKNRKFKEDLINSVNPGWKELRVSDVLDSSLRSESF